MDKPTPIDLLGQRAEALARARKHLADFVAAMNEGLERLRADNMPGLRQCIDAGGAAWSALEAEIKAHPECFVRPRTMSLHGIKFGFAKGKGGLEIADPDRTVALIRKHLPDQADVLIATREAPVKDALAQLPADQLKRIGVEVKGTGDTVVIRPADSDLDKLVKALVGEAAEGEAQ